MKLLHKRIAKLLYSIARNVFGDYILQFVVENEVYRFNCSLLDKSSYTHNIIYTHYDNNGHFVMGYAQLLYIKSSEYKVQTLPCLAYLPQVFYCPSVLSEST